MQTRTMDHPPLGSSHRMSRGAWHVRTSRRVKTIVAGPGSDIGSLRRYAQAGSSQTELGPRLSGRFWWYERNVGKTGVYVAQVGYVIWAVLGQRQELKDGI